MRRLAYRPRGDDSQVPAVVLGTGLSCVRDQGLDRLLGALPQPATLRSLSTTGTSATAVESPAARLAPSPAGGIATRVVV
jgi:hypothetical protein